jgi:hypothetical protein
LELTIVPRGTIGGAMVATVETPCVGTTKRSLAPGQGFLSPDQKIKARTLYLVHNKGPKEISEMLSCNWKALTNLINHRGWAKLRNKNWIKAEAEVVAIVENDVAETAQRIAIESEELTIGSLNVLRNSIATGNAKDMQAASGAARNLVDIARRCRNLDNRVETNQGTSTNVNMFVFAAPATVKAEKNITPSTAITVS